MEDLTPNDLMIKFTERSIEVCKRVDLTGLEGLVTPRWWQFGLAHDPRTARVGPERVFEAVRARPTLQQLNKEKCYWTMTKRLLRTSLGRLSLKRLLESLVLRAFGPRGTGDAIGSSP